MSELLGELESKLIEKAAQARKRWKKPISPCDFDYWTGSEHAYLTVLAMVRKMRKECEG